MQNQTSKNQKIITKIQRYSYEYEDNFCGWKESRYSNFDFLYMEEGDRKICNFEFDFVTICWIF